jgi:uncharacterized membrane protein YqjE
MTQDTDRSWVESTVAGLLSDVRSLMRQELLLARHEVQYETGKIVKAAMLFGIALALAGVGLSVVAAACVLILFEYTGLPAWACAAIVCIISLGGAWGLVVAGRGVAKSVHMVPQRTVQTILGDAKGIAEWVRTRYT